MVQYLVMYDVRGIQDFIFRTPKVKDAIGASYLVENIIQKALAYAVDEEDRITYNLKWYDIKKDDSKAVKHYDSTSTEQVQVLFIGGGNAFVLIGHDSLEKAKDLVITINQRMSKYVIDHTFSLQLAAAFVEKTDDYAKDYFRVFEELIRVKASMNVSMPFGALPIMKTELRTGYPLSKKYKSPDNFVEDVSFETKLKKDAAHRSQNETGVNHANRILDNLTEGKGSNSTLAVVHIDGNNMGLRIRDLIQGVSTYDDAVNRMRAISLAISEAFQKAFNEMNAQYNKMGGNEDNPDYFIRKILVAGDDITYVCTGKIALSTIEFFAKEISGNSMVDYLPGLESEKEKYIFSICAGAAFMSSHFPFDIAYDVAEACCESAKGRAKKEVNLEPVKIGDQTTKLVGNWVDFSLCKSVCSRDLEAMRTREYLTPSGEYLLIRPYRISTKTASKQADSPYGKEYDFSTFKNNVKWLNGVDKNGKANLPRSVAKDLRNTYPLGEDTVNSLKSFMDSRGHYILGNKEEEFYLSPEEDKTLRIARFYDALEMMDDFEEVFPPELSKEVS